MFTILKPKDKHNEEKHDLKKPLGVTSAVVTLSIMIITMLITVAVLEKEPHIPLMIGTAAVSYTHL